ncbi:hypothetical protein TNCV_2093111 [Trichonephila clavipes]|nr:hypothetical protein TNCV_2093111 [Trichonephila clavipes]
MFKRLSMNTCDNKCHSSTKVLLSFGRVLWKDAVKLQLLYLEHPKRATWILGLIGDLDGHFILCIPSVSRLALCPEWSNIIVHKNELHALPH